MLDFSEFWLFFSFVQKRLFMQTSSKEYKFISKFVIILDTNVQIFLQNGDAQSQKLPKMQIPIKSPFLIFFQKKFMGNSFYSTIRKFVFNKFFV